VYNIFFLAIVDEIVTDFSWAAMNAISRAFNNMSIKQYIDTCFEIMEDGDLEKLRGLTVIRNCSSHITKNIKKDIDSNTKKLTILERKFLCSVIGSLFTARNTIVLNDLLKKLINLMMHKFISPAVNEAMSTFKSYGESLDDRAWSEGIAEEAESNSIMNIEYEESKTIYKDSKFFQKYRKFVQDIKQAEKGERNKFFNPILCATFLKKYIAFVPMWTGVLSFMRNPDATRANNCFVESKFYLN
jgi:hypothetical protein